MPVKGFPASERRPGFPAFCFMGFLTLTCLILDKKIILFKRHYRRAGGGCKEIISAIRTGEGVRCAGVVFDRPLSVCNMIRRTAGDWR